MDGTLGSRTARMLDGTGVEITSRAALEEIVRRASAAGFAVAVHAIGDRANREALDAFEATREHWQPRGLRPRIEHAQCVHPDDVPRFARLGVAASVQYTHATSDRDVADRLWGDRAAHASYSYASLLAAGARLAGGSDAPVEALDPLAGLRAAVLRTDGDRPPWRPEQAIGLGAALASFTTGPAWLAGEEHVRGRIAPGLLADLVVLDRDPVAGLEDARVAGTMLAGKVDAHTSRKRMIRRPMRTSSPWCRRDSITRRPLTKTPLRLRSSAITGSPSRSSTMAWRRDTVASSSTMSAPGRRPIRVSRPSRRTTTPSPSGMAR